MHSKFIELHRRFQQFEDDDLPEGLAERSYIASMFKHEVGISWDELLKHRIAVILGEPGSGKSSELKERQRRCRSISFFLRLDQLVSEDVENILDEEKTAAFRQWKNNQEEAVFFLDAVDESKLLQNADFCKALERVKKSIGFAILRARFVISSRIIEWNPRSDRDSVLQILGMPKIEQPEKQTQRSTRTIATLFNNNKTKEDAKAANETDSEILVAYLLPLNTQQIQQFATGCGVQQPENFLTALNNCNAWGFAGRPMDVELLYAYWNEIGQLSSLTDLTEFMVSRLLSEVPDKKKQDLLTPEQARTGAESLAAAVILCRKLRIRVSDETNFAEPHLLDPSAVLAKDWTAAQRHAITDRALFDAASHGSISFHHRSHTEYLAASWITRLMAHNCSLDALEDLLFAQVRGQRVLRPTLAPVAAWLITEGQEPWRLRLAEWLLETAPDIFLQHGDPAALPLTYRRRILSKIITQFTGRKQVTLNWNSTAMVRFSDAQLAPDINRFLLDTNIGEDLRGALLRLVRDGELIECIPAALRLFAEPNLAEFIKIYAVKVIRDIGDIAARRKLAQLWPSLPQLQNRLINLLCQTLFPMAIDVTGFLELLAKSDTSTGSSDDLEYALNPLLEYKLPFDSMYALLKGLMGLLATPPFHEHFKLCNRYQGIVKILPECLYSILREKNISELAFDDIGAAIFALEKMQHFVGISGISTNDDDIVAIREAFNTHLKLKRHLFWMRIAQIRTQTTHEPNEHMALGDDAIPVIGPRDLPWLLEDARTSQQATDRYLAIKVAANLLWSTNYSLQKTALKLWKASSNSSDLRLVCYQEVKRRLVAPFMRLWIQQVRFKLLKKYWWKQHLYTATNFYSKIEGRIWLWRHLGDLRKGQYPFTLEHVARLAEDRNNNRLSGSNWSAVEKEYGTAISDAVKEGCINTWKQYSPQLPHEKQALHQTNLRCIVGLVGIQTCWNDGKLDFSMFSISDVDRAIRYAANELNDVPEWFSLLLQQRPTEAVDTLEKAFAGEWTFPEELDYVHEVVAKLARTPDMLAIHRQIFIRNLLISDPCNPQVLRDAIRPIQVDEKLAALAASRIIQYGDHQQQWHTWFCTWLQLDALPALVFLENHCLSKSSAAGDELIIGLCATLSGHRGHLQVIPEPSFLTPAALTKFIPLVYRHIRPIEDIHRTGSGVYSPSTRDDAQDFRSQLWNGLQNSRLTQADEVLRSFLHDPFLADQRDWILHILDERKNLFADNEPWAAQDIRTFEERYRVEPRSNYQLFQVTCRLLHNIKDHVERSENASNRNQVRIEDREIDLRGFLARELNERSLNWFNATQESEVDLAQRPDVTIHRPGLDAIPVEVKLANLAHWPLHKLLECLENQLVGQYLRPSNVNFGIYVLGNTVPKRRWKIPGSTEKIDFAEVVLRLQERAAELVAELQNGVDGIQVIGIDFSDPRER